MEKDDSGEMTPNYELYEIVRRKDGRWIVVYGKDLPQAGKQWKGTVDYSTREAAEKAIKGEDTKRGMFDRFMMDIEPEPMEWDGSDEDSGEEPEADEEPAGEGMLSKQSMKSGGIAIYIVLGGSGMLKGE